MERKSIKIIEFPESLNVEEARDAEKVQMWIQEANCEFEKAMEMNVPVLFKVLPLVSTWKAFQKWTREDGTINTEFLVNNYGNEQVPVSDCSDKCFSDHPKFEMSLSKYFESWESPQSTLWYLKDWHYCIHHPQENIYETPIFFQKDWLNFYWDHRNSLADQDDPANDYRFVYIGPKGSWTPFHCDVFGSYSWSINISGRKLWRMLPKEYSHLCYHKHISREHIFSLDSFDPDVFPDALRISEHLIHIEQGPGEIIFVPSGWHHQVTNLEDTLSINHNWCNEHNAVFMFEQLEKQWEMVCESLSDCHDGDQKYWESQCLHVLKAWTGIDFQELTRIVLCVFEKADFEKNSVRIVCEELLMRMKSKSYLMKEADEIQSFLERN